MQEDEGFLEIDELDITVPIVEIQDNFSASS
jgi:hypothetical protein